MEAPAHQPFCTVQIVANRIAGLVGPGTGPWVHTHLLTKLKVRISGFAEGIVRVVTLEKEYEFTKAGVFDLEDTPMAKVEYDGPDRTMVCTFVSGVRRAAV